MALALLMLLAAGNPYDANRLPPEDLSNIRASWATYVEYPAEALRNNWEGIAGYTLTIDAEGRVTNCEITLSTGYPVLDRATCDQMSSRTRYTPARNDRGEPVPGRIAGLVDWKIDG